MKELLNNKINPVADLNQFETLLLGLDEYAKVIIRKIRSNDSELKEINLSGVDIGSNGLKALFMALVANSNLTNLKLKRCGIVNADVKYIGNILIYNSSLITLNISNNRIGIEGYKILANALKINTTLNTLILDGNYTEGLFPFVILEALKLNRIITEVSHLDITVCADSLLSEISAPLRRNKYFKNKIEQITKPLYKTDTEGYPAWQTNPLRNAEMLGETIKEIVFGHRSFKNSKLLQELYGLQCLCLAHHFFNVFLFSKNHNYKDVLDLVIKCLKLAEVMGYHVHLSHKMALDMINDVDMTDNLESAYYRKYLDENLPGKNEQHRIDLRESYPGYYGYSRLRLQHALNRQAELFEEELNHVKPLSCSNHTQCSRRK